MEKIKIRPWVEITCIFCGCMAEHSGFYYRGIIKALQNDAKDWIYDSGAICPECQIKNGYKDKRTQGTCKI